MLLSQRITETLERKTFEETESRAGESRPDCSLDELPVGASARVAQVKGAGAIARRLMEMGVVPGAPVQFVKAAPLGDPLEIRVRGYHLALRRTEAQTIIVTPN
ncbi:MAG: FeoA family protein [Pyrinomonadaceae bacterium]